MKFVLLIKLKVFTIANSFLLNIADNENFSANIYEVPTIVGIIIFKSREIFMLSLVEHEKYFITSRPGPSCSKLMMSLVNVLLKFTSSDTQIC